MLDRAARIIEIDGIGPVLFERSRRATRINITIKPSGTVRVCVPYRISFKKAQTYTGSKSHWINKHLERFKRLHIPSLSHDIDRESAKTCLTLRLKTLAGSYGFKYNRVFIRNQRTRWGSCSGKNNISLNMKLVKLPQELVDYVILHELVHTRIKNHGESFWEEVGKLAGDTKSMRSRLRKWAAALG